MKNLPLPVGFQDRSTMETWANQLNNQIHAICEAYGELSLISSIIIDKNTQTNTVAITSMGSVVRGSKREKAMDAIIDKFEAMFNGDY